MPSPIRRPAESISGKTYHALLNLIATRQLEPGDVIEERRLAERFEVSRTPLRAAIHRLLGEGALQRLSNGLVVVREVGMTEYLNLLAVRMLLESEAAALAAPRVPLQMLARIEQRLHETLRSATDEHGPQNRLDDEIHDVVAGHCGNESLARFITEIHRRIRMRNLANAPDRLIPACHEHLALVKALQARDVARSRQAMIDHLVGVRTSYLRLAGLAAYDEGSR